MTLEPFVSLEWAHFAPFMSEKYRHSAYRYANNYSVVDVCYYTSTTQYSVATLLVGFDLPSNPLFDRMTSLLAFCIRIMNAGKDLRSQILSSSNFL